MFFKKKRGLFSDNLEVSKKCATCKFGKQLLSSDDIICPKYGLVSENHICRHYDYNRLMKRPPKKRLLNSSFVKDDFSID